MLELSSLAGVLNRLIRRHVVVDAAHWNNHLHNPPTDLVAHGSPLQQQSEAVDCLFVVLQALAQPAVIILHQSSIDLLG